MEKNEGIRIKKHEKKKRIGELKGTKDMERFEVARTIDHAILRPEATDDDLIREINEVMNLEIASVCVKPIHVALAHQLLIDHVILVSTVIGFPHGTTTTAVKCFEAQEAIQNGAKELDMVINIGKLIQGDFEFVRKDIEAIVHLAHSKEAIVKVIIECAFLTQDLKKIACHLSEEASADYVKTSTGFNGHGATIEDIILMRQILSDHTKIKASGGIQTFWQAEELLKMGANRLGTSKTVQILAM